MSGWRRAFLLLTDIGVGRPTHAPHCSRVSILLVGPTVIGACRCYASVVRPQWPHIFIQRTEKTRPATPERFGGARKRSGGRVVGLGGGIIAGIVFAMFEMIVAAIMGDGFFAALMMIGAIVLG